MIIPDIARPIAQPNTRRFAKNAISGKPSEKIEYRNRSQAKKHAPPTPITARSTLIVSCPAMYSGKRQRRDEQVAEVPRVQLLDERERDAELAAEEHIPQEHRADEEARRVLEEVVRGREIQRHEGPDDHRHRRVVHHRDDARPRLEYQVRVPAEDRAHAAQRRHCARRPVSRRRPSSSERRDLFGGAAGGRARPPGHARCRGTPPPCCRVRSGRAAPAGEPWSTTRPSRSMITSSHIRSTSPMWCEASSIVQPVRRWYCSR